MFTSISCNLTVEGTETGGNQPNTLHKMPILAILLGLFDQISKVNSPWSIAAFTAIVILLALRYVAKIGKEKISTPMFLVCVGLIFLIGLSPIIANIIGQRTVIPYKIITEVRDPSNLIYDAEGLSVNNSLNKPTRRVDNEWEFNFNKDDLTPDSLVTISAQTTNKLFRGDTTVRITASLNYSATIILKRTGVPPPPRDTIHKKTFSLNFASSNLLQMISSRTGLASTLKSADCKVAVSYDEHNIRPGPDGNYMLDACYPIITINGATRAQVKCCKIDGTGWTTKPIIINYLNEKLRGSAEQCYQDQINTIIACLKREK